MANLKMCPDCQSDVSNLAKQCPRCGRPLKAERKPLGLAGGCLLVGFCVLILPALIMPAIRGARETAKREARPRKVVAPKVPGLDRFTIQDRMNIYREESEAGVAASRLADQTHHMDAIALSPDAARLTEERHAIYEQAKTEAVNRIKAKYGVGEEALQAIIAEGVKKRWPGP